MRIRGINYHVEIHSEGKPLVLLHGFTGSSQSWKPVLKELSRAKYQVILIDIIGHGKTEIPKDPSRYRMNEVTKDILSILDELKVDKVNIHGYSMGGRLALAFAADYPYRVAKLILESSSPGLQLEVERKERKEADERLADEILNKGLKHFVDKWENLPLFKTQKSLPQDTREAIREQRLQNSPVGLANSLLGMGTGIQEPKWRDLKKLDIPVLILCGEYDKKFCEIGERMHQLLQNSSLQKIKRAGHAIHVEQPRIFGKIVDEFLKM